MRLLIGILLLATIQHVKCKMNQFLTNNNNNNNGNINDDSSSSSINIHNNHNNVINNNYNNKSKYGNIITRQTEFDTKLNHLVVHSVTGRVCILNLINFSVESSFLIFKLTFL